MKIYIINILYGLICSHFFWFWVGVVCELFFGHLWFPALFVYSGNYSICHQPWVRLFYLCVLFLFLIFYFLLYFYVLEFAFLVIRLHICILFLSAIFQRKNRWAKCSESCTLGSEGKTKQIRVDRPILSLFFLAWDLFYFKFIDACMVANSATLLLMCDVPILQDVFFLSPSYLFLILWWCPLWQL